MCVRLPKLHLKFTCQGHLIIKVAGHAHTSKKARWWFAFDLKALLFMFSFCSASCIQHIKRVTCACSDEQWCSRRRTRGNAVFPTDIRTRSNGDAVALLLLAYHQKERAVPICLNTIRAFYPSYYLDSSPCFFPSPFLLFTPFSFSILSFPSPVRSRPP